MEGVGGKATVGVSIFAQCFRDFSWFDASINVLRLTLAKTAV